MVEPRGRRPIACRWLAARGLPGAVAIAMALPVAAAARQSSPPCAACVVLAIAPGDPEAADVPDVPVAVVIRVSSTGDSITDSDAVAAALSLVPQARAVAVILDARPVAALTDEARYRLRTLATAARAARDLLVGVELLPSQIHDPSIDALAGYVDFVVLPADTADVSTRLPGTTVWTAAASGAPSAFDIVTSLRLPNSEHVLVRLSETARDIVSVIAGMRDVVPGGLIPLPGVRVTCDAGCDADVYLNPQTLDAVAVVRPHGPVTQATVTPAATALATFAGVQARGTGPRLELPATPAPFILQIRGWRGTTDETFATGVEVTGARALTVEEIVARHQAARARQERAVRTLISTGSTVLTFRVPGFPGPLTVTARTTVFAGSGQIDIEQEQIRVNGLDLPRRSGDAPKLPLIEPERVAAPPLRILLTEAYSYAPSGRQRVNGRDAYIVSFTPRDSRQTLFEGRAWIDSQTFVLLRTDATQTALGGPVASSREVDAYEASDEAGVAVSFLQRAEIFQVYVGPVGSTPIHRIVTFDRHEVNAPDYAPRLEAAHRSDGVLLRDTPQGYRFLVPQSSTGGEPRRLSSSNREHVATAVAGSLFDPNISVPLVFAGVSYVDFNLFRTGTQVNAFFGGTYGRFSWATRPLMGTRWRLSGDASGLAVSYNDRAFRAGIEHYDENIHQRPAQMSLAVVGPVAAAVRLRAGYDLGYTRYTRAETTAANFLVPASTPVHGARIALEAEHGPWNATAWFSAARRQQWQPWGMAPSIAQLDAQTFERYGATLARSVVWSPRSVAHVEMAWMTGRRLDRFSEFTFGTFDNPLRGYPGVSIRYTTGAAVRSVATWTPTAHVRLDGFADLGIARGPGDDQRSMYPGVGAAIEVPAPLGWLLAAEWGYGPRGVKANGSSGTHVVRLTGYKMF
jgi:hypothetical protein